ncbi:hypothetical protein EBZ39_08740 [bacterium]|nr:hypothetical protein [bacterium]
MAKNFIYVVWYLDADNHYHPAGYFDNQVDAQACVDSFKDHHAYAANMPVNVQLVTPSELNRTPAHQF